MEKLKELVISFFKRMNATIIEKADHIVIDNVEPIFQESYEKPAPYLVSFSEKDILNNSLDCFYPGTKLFKVIMNALNKNTSTTILKINLKIDPLAEIEKRISLKNCLLKNIKQDYENNFFSRFSFKTNFRYLNKNEEIIEEIFIHSGKIIQGNLKDYDISEGELKEVDTKYMEKDYNIAREKVRELIKPKVREISSEISERLKKEIQRIQDHYAVQKKEFYDSMEKNKKRIKEIESEAETPEKQEKIQKLKKLNEETIRKEIEKLDKEEVFTINDEKQKHAVSMDTKLTNTTVLYYPLYHLNLLLEDGLLKKNFQIIYDPLTSEMQNTNCESCEKQMKQIALCKTGHVCCPTCLFRCGSCGGQFCKDCLKDKCNSCGSPICESCKRICKKCKRTYCKQHIREDSVSGEEYCLDCLGFCSECSKTALKKDLKEISPGKSVCFKCQAMAQKKKVLKNIFH